MAKAICDDAGQVDAALRLIGRSHKVAILAHINPDGDTLGSSLALARALAQQGKEVVTVCADSLPDNLSYLPGYDEIFTDGRLPNDIDTIIMVDASDLERLGAAYELNRTLFASVRTLNVDHHATSTCYGDVNLVNGGSAATGEQVYDLLLAMGHPIDPQIATCLLTAIVTDTRVFRTASTTPKSLAISAALFELGAPLFPIVEIVYRNRPLTTLRLWGLALHNLKWLGGIAWTVVTQAMQDQVGASASEGDGVVDLVSSLRNVKAVAVFRETADGVKISLRSADAVDVSEVAAHFGGGGHPRASGCTISGSLADVERLVVDHLVEKASR